MSIDNYRYNLDVDGNSFFSPVHIFSYFHDTFGEHISLTLGSATDVLEEKDLIKLCKIINKIEPIKQEKTLCANLIVGQGRGDKARNSITNIVGVYECGVIIHVFQSSCRTFHINNLLDSYIDDPKEFSKFGNINIYCLDPEDIKNKELSKLLKELTVVHNDYKRKSDKNEHFIGILTENAGGGLHIQNHSIAEWNNDLKFEDLYNDDFFEINENIIKTLDEKETGITLLHGKPGTGKTSYLRWLIRNKSNKNFVYMPPFITSKLGSPDFISFLVKNASRKMVYIVEDAETILKTREAGGNEAAANLLNASSGLLGDVIKAHFICTFNCDEDQIDKALLRPGRLVDRYEFEALTKIKTKKLWNKIHGEIEQPKDRMTLAEIFNHGAITNPIVEEKQSFGFIPNANS